MTNARATVSLKGLALIALLHPVLAMAQEALHRTTLSASPSSGPAPLTVTFDNVGTSIQYGDGHIGPLRSNGAKVGRATHTYSVPGTYNATSDDSSVTITVQEASKR